MYLKSLEVQGFKSFPDKTVIRFGDDITAIVGPNGSGKSNISDAILWVMGEQSTKTLRGAKMEDVIFGGTQKRAAVGFAEATLTLDNTDRALAYESDEVMITRRYYRSGDSEYYINRQSARLRDIHELFMDTGLGREGYSNIGQGRIDEILSLKSADRREIFEEAAGISKYRHRKEETERKLGHTEENLTRIGDKISELELQLEPLRVQSEKAKKYIAYRDELQGIEVAVWLDKLDKLSAEAQKAAQDYVSASFVLEQAREDLDKLYAGTATLTADLRLKSEQVESLRVQVSMLEGARQQLEGQITVLQGNIRNNEENIARSQQDLEGQQDRSSGIEAQLAQNTVRMEQIAAELAEKQTALEKHQQELSQMMAAAQGMTKRFIELRSAEVQYTGDLSAREADLRSIEEGASITASRQKELEQDLLSGSQRQAAAKEELRACREELKKAREEVKATNNAIAGYTLRQQTRVQRAQTEQQKLEDNKRKLDAVTAKTNVYKAMEKDFEGYHKSVRIVMQEAQKGVLRRVHGPVSQLIRTDDAYTVAVEVALGAALQQIVVDTEADGKAAINHLKRIEGGRATFLPLSVITGRELKENGLEKCDGFVGIASSLVSCDKSYRQIVENLLGRIVITRDLDSAVAIAGRYGNRFKVVSLDGQVVNPGGSMTGGSGSKEAGMLSRANKLEKLLSQQSKLQQTQQELELAYQEAKRSADQVQFQLETAREQLAEGEKQVLTLEGREKQHEIWLQAIEEAVSAAQKEKDALMERHIADRERSAALQAQLKILESQLDKTRQELEVLQGSQEESEQAVSGVTEQMQLLRTDMAALDAERTTAQTHSQDLRVLLLAAQGDKERKLRDIDAIREEIGVLEQQILDLQEKHRENALEITNVRTQLEQTQSQYAQTEAQKTKTEGDIQEKNKYLVDLEKACVLLENKKETTAIEERNTIDRLWETYSLTPSTAQEKRGEIESVASATRRIAELKRSISHLGTPNLGAIEEFARVNERYSYLTEQRDDVLTSKKYLEGIIRDITGQMTEIFVTEFEKINHYFEQTFVEMFGGGKGQLVLEDPEQPLTCGIEIRVQPPGKQLKTITLLSGGEKAFVAIALYFAILKVRPTPFCMLDEIDAALDDRNVERFATYLRNLAEKTQFIVITHRRGTMEASDVLYGVTMQEQGISKLLRLDLNQMEEQLGIIE